MSAETNCCRRCGNPERLHGPRPDPAADDGFGGDTFRWWHPFEPAVITPQFDAAAYDRVSERVNRFQVALDETRPAKYPAEVLDELLKAGEISEQQYERLRRE